MPRPLKGLLAAVGGLALCGAAYAVRTGRLLEPAPPASTGPHPALAAVPPNDEGEQLVVLFGDSLTELAIADVRRRFVDDPDLRLSAQYYGGTQLDTETWTELYPLVDEGSVVLLFLGVNDVFDGSVAEAQRAAEMAIDRLTAAGASRVVVATVNTDGRGGTLPADWRERTRAFNDWLWEADADDVRYPALEVAPWDLMSAGRRDWFRGDGIHLTQAGAAAYAELIHGAAG